MKIEKINENQIRCTLNKDDLLDRQLRLSELAYGTEKAKLLFRDMMQQAAYEFGFEADDIPLMIEAIPVSTDCLVLVVTKVEDPDELDTRFSKFSPNQSETTEFDLDDNSYADEILNCFSQLDTLLGDTINTDNTPSKENDFISLPESLNITEKEDSKTPTKSSSPISAEKDLSRIFIFSCLDDLIHLSYQLSSYQGINSLYKDTSNHTYYLVLSKTNHTPEEFNRICNIVSEYGKSLKTSYAAPHYYEEHFDLILKNNALQSLSHL